MGSIITATVTNAMTSDANLHIEGREVKGNYLIKGFSEIKLQEWFMQKFSCQTEMRFYTPS